MGFLDAMGRPLKHAQESASFQETLSEEEWELLKNFRKQKGVQKGPEQMPVPKGKAVHDANAPQGSRPQTLAVTLGSMSDASKRRNDFSVEDMETFLNDPANRPWVAAEAEDAEEACLSEASMELLSERWYPTLVDGAKMPAGVGSLHQWGRTRVTMAKFKARGWTFQEIAAHGMHHGEVRKYLSWICERYTPAESISECFRQQASESGLMSLVHEPVNQATDLAMYLKAAGWVSLKDETAMLGGYRREFQN